MLKISLHAYSSSEQLELQPRMAKLVMGCNGWIIEEITLSPAACRLRFEIDLADIADFYVALQQSGVQLMPLGHRALTEMYMCWKYLPNRGEAWIVSVDLHLGTRDEEHVQFRRLVRIHPV